MVSTSFIEWMSQITKYIQLETYLVALMIVGGGYLKNARFKDLFRCYSTFRWYFLIQLTFFVLYTHGIPEKKKKKKKARKKKDHSIYNECTAYLLDYQTDCLKWIVEIYIWKE